MQLPYVQTRFLDLPGSFPLRNGAVVEKVRIAYEQYGTPSPEKDNVILLFHALSGSQHAYGYNPDVPGIGALWKPENHEGWWNSIIGPGKPLDTDRFCIICANYLGGCYGTTGPASPSPVDNLPYGSRFRMWKWRTRPACRRCCWTPWGLNACIWSVRPWAA